MRQTHASAPLEISAVTFTNYGTLRATSGATLIVDAASPVTNLEENGTSLVGGTYEVAEGDGLESRLEFRGSGVDLFASLNARVILTGAMSMLYSGANGDAKLSETLQIIGTGGELDLLIGGELDLINGINTISRPNFITEHDLQVAGTIRLTGAGLQAAADSGGRFIVEATGTVFGSGIFGYAASMRGNIENNGRIVSSNASGSADHSFDIFGEITGTGILEIGAGSILDIEGAVGSGQVIVFNNPLATSHQTLIVGQTSIGLGSAFQAYIRDFAAGDVIDLSGFSFADFSEYSFDGSILSLNFSGDVANLNLGPSNLAGDTQFTLSDDAGGGTLIVIDTDTNNPPIVNSIAIPIGVAVGTSAVSSTIAFQYYDPDPGQSVSVAGLSRDGINFTPTNGNGNPVSDPDRELSANVAGTWGTLHIWANGEWLVDITNSVALIAAIEASPDQVVTNSFTYRVSDGHGGFADASFHINWNDILFDNIDGDGATTTLTGAVGAAIDLSSISIHDSGGDATYASTRSPSRW